MPRRRPAALVVVPGDTDARAEVVRVGIAPVAVAREVAEQGEVVPFSRPREFTAIHAAQEVVVRAAIQEVHVVMRDEKDGVAVAAARLVAAIHHLEVAKRRVLDRRRADVEARCDPVPPGIVHDEVVEVAVLPAPDFDT